MGTWKMNRDNSKHNDGEPLPRSLVIRFEPYPGGEVVTIWRTTQEGRSETDSFVQYYDGKDHPYPREEQFDSVNARKLQDATVSVVFKKGGRIVFRQTRRLMTNGQQMRIEEQLLSKSGRWLDRVLVFEKQND
jgi:hypothetical protein